MIYQLAKTSVLLGGQTKINLILNGTKVSDIQYSPISNYIPFNYNVPQDVLNYTHGQNVKMLYEKISDWFFTGVCNPKLSTKRLHRYDTYIDDTHEGTYEMGMKRCEYQRYKKQFEFFCPIWFTDINELKNAKFEIVLEKRTEIKEGTPVYKRIYSAFLDTTILDKYADTFYEGIDDKNENTDLLYINFKECLSHIKGLNAETGYVQTVDTSYVINNLLSQERPVLETDNMLANLFASNHIVATQLLNLNFVFNIEDFAYPSLLKSMEGERFNAYINVYAQNSNNKYEKVTIKDLYTNYEFIPKYDTIKGEYSKEGNVLDYLNDNKAISLIDKNKLVQSTFHWIYESNEKSIFNLYNGFSPTSKSKVGNSINCDNTDMFTDIFDITKNPLQVFKYTNLEEITVEESSKIPDLVNDDNYFYSVKLPHTLKVNINNMISSSFNMLINQNVSEELIFDDNENVTETQLFGNILIDNKKLLANINTVNNMRVFNKSKFQKNKKFDDYKPNNWGYIEISKGSTNKTTQTDLNTADIFNKSIKCAAFLLNNQFDYNILRSLLSADWLLTTPEYVFSLKSTILPLAGAIDLAKPVVANTNKTFIAVSNTDAVLKICVFITDIDDYITKKFMYFDQLKNDYFKKNNSNKYIATTYANDNIYNVTLEANEDFQLAKKNCDYPNGYDGMEKIIKRIKNQHLDHQRKYVYAAFKLLSNVLKCSIYPNIIEFDNSINQIKYNSPNIKTTEMDFIKSEKYSKIYRYDSNLLPMLIDLDDSIYSNYIYWCKQYNKNIYTASIDTKNPDNIKSFSDYALTGFEPIYPSIDYFALKEANSNYNKFYFDIWNNTVDATNSEKLAKLKSQLESYVNRAEIVDGIIKQGIAKTEYDETYEKLHDTKLNKTTGIYLNHETYKKSTGLYQYTLYPIRYNIDDVQLLYKYLNDYEYVKEISWYKSNNLLYLPISFTSQIIIKTGTQITDEVIINLLEEKLVNLECFNDPKKAIKTKDNKKKFIKYCIKDLYSYTYTYDYYSNDNNSIEQQIVTIDFKLK